MNSLSDSIPIKIRVSFFEHQRKEWEKVLQTSKGNLVGESQPECLLHWETVSSYALQKIKEIDEQLQQLRLNMP
jgi:hypothetical protein